MEPTLWLLKLGHACLWGSVAVAAVGAACRCLPRLPAAVRAWLWWLACAKMLLGLWAIAPINLPLLPAPAPATRSAPAVTAAVRPQASLPAARSVPAVVAATVTEVTAASDSSAPRWPLLVFAVWLLGVAVSAGFALRQSFTARRLGRGAFPAVLPGIDLNALARQIGLRRTPRVLTGPQIQTPCVSGWHQPSILLPPGLSGTLALPELRLILAHEMAHLKRFDLPLALVPLLARTLFFFDPFAWRAAAEWVASAGRSLRCAGFVCDADPRCRLWASAAEIGCSGGDAACARLLTRLLCPAPPPDQPFFCPDSAAPTASSSVCPAAAAALALVYSPAARRSAFWPGTDPLLCDRACR